MQMTPAFMANLHSFRDLHTALYWSVRETGVGGGLGIGACNGSGDNWLSRRGLLLDFEPDCNRAMPSNLAVVAERDSIVEWKGWGVSPVPDASLCSTVPKSGADDDKFCSDRLTSGVTVTGVVDAGGPTENRSVLGGANEFETKSQFKCSSKLCLVMGRSHPLHTTHKWFLYVVDLMSIVRQDW